MKRKAIPRAFKDTELNRVRVNKNIKIGEIADAIHFSEGIVGMYFTGQRLPTTETCEAICNFLGINPVWGMSEFLQANNDWNAEHNRKLKVRGRRDTKEDILQMKRGSVGKPRFSKRTFWTEKRTASGFTLQDLSDLTKIEYSTLSKYFTGQTMPIDDTIKQLCDLFGVDFKEGKHEFRKAYTEWHRKNSLSKREVEPTKPVNYSLVEKVADIVYGKVSFEDFKALMTGSAVDISHFYGKVDFETFNTIMQTIKEV